MKPNMLYSLYFFYFLKLSKTIFFYNIYFRSKGTLDTGKNSKKKLNRRDSFEGLDSKPSKPAPRRGVSPMVSRKSTQGLSKKSPNPVGRSKYDIDYLKYISI